MIWMWYGWQLVKIEAVVDILDVTLNSSVLIASQVDPQLAGISIELNSAKDMFGINGTKYSF